MTIWPISENFFMIQNDPLTNDLIRDSLKSYSVFSQNQMIKLRIKDKTYLFVIDLLLPNVEKTLKNSDNLDVTILKSCTEVDYRVRDDIYSYMAFDLNLCTEDVRKRTMNEVLQAKGLDLDAIEE